MNFELARDITDVETIAAGRGSVICPGPAPLYGKVVGGKMKGIARIRL